MDIQAVPVARRTSYSCYHISIQQTDRFQKSDGTSIEIRNLLLQEIQIEKLGDALKGSLDLAQKRSGPNLLMLQWGTNKRPPTKSL
jgi:hypothetical protein